MEAEVSNARRVGWLVVELHRLEVRSWHLHLGNLYPQNLLLDLDGCQESANFILSSMPQRGRGIVC